jgi:hypothetical protein
MIMTPRPKQRSIDPVPVLIVLLLGFIAAVAIIADITHKSANSHVPGQVETSPEHSQNPTTVQQRARFADAQPVEIQKPVPEVQKKPIDLLPLWAFEFNVPGHRRCTATLSPLCFLKVYEMNELAADQYFKGNRVVFHDLDYAVVKQIGRDAMGKPYIILRTSNDDIRSVQAFFQSDSVPAQLQPNDHLALECTASGLMLNLILEDCTVYQVRRWSGDTEYDHEVKLK